MPGVTAFRATVSGHVQGVGFRYWAARRAERLGLAGWVTNLADGAVAVFAQGPSAELDAFGRWLAEGPAAARVASVEQHPEAPDPALTRFEIR